MIAKKPLHIVSIARGVGARRLREKYRLTSGTRLQVVESDQGLVLAPLKQARQPRQRAGWRALRGAARGTNPLKEHLAEHRREAKR